MKITQPPYSQAGRESRNEISVSNSSSIMRYSIYIKFTILLINKSITLLVRINALKT